MATISEQFLVDHAERYHRLVAQFRPSPLDTKAARGASVASPEIIVCSRVRPMLADEMSQGIPAGVHIRRATNTADVHELRQAVRGLPMITVSSSNYTVDKLFGPDATTVEIYDSVVKPLIPWAWGGGIGTLFAYGQTGSGKTFTVSDLERRVAEDLMNGSLEGARKTYISIIELSGQTAFDLLNSRKQISILEDSFGNTQMAGVHEHQVSDKDTLLGYIEAAASLRQTASTLKNDTSSRSHAVCRIRLENPQIPSAEDGVLYLIDLAGSEAARDKVSHDAARMKEAREINTSLSVLKDCIRGRALADADSMAGKTTKPAYVPFRRSTLTKTLKHIFDPASARSCKTVVIACVNPCLADVGASKNTLRFAELLRVVVPKPKPAAYDPAVPITWDNAQLRAWIGNNSGTPPIHAAALAPTETGPQLLRLPLPEFLARSLQTPGVTAAQAQAIQTKLWALHIDSQRGQARATDTIGRDGAGGTAVARMARLDCSADPEDGVARVPWRERIRPGMVVGWVPGPEHASVAAAAAAGGGKCYAVVLCPVGAVGPRVRDVRGAVVNPGGVAGAEPGVEREGREAYLCAMMTPAMAPMSFAVSLWRQEVVRMEQMEAEVLMEWDEATRYYYMVI
ncbi:P-loop containing nucleoside triphosphate hydrolase protein [Trichocladium antarcticum]|uniref:Kinesin-like protein n=1 Tax=Trichocladium antarcticum TaxID=1450529 RepID=A0AAN6Z9Y9_9PEZI|nr:P-loop containing nucleoside triphosphate hydrolase protein [Trichocladium antarcticum]